MYVLIEGYHYPADKIPQALKKGAFQNVKREVVFNYVGYYYSPEMDDCVFFLPKVLVQDVVRKECGNIVYKKDRWGNVKNRKKADGAEEPIPETDELVFGTLRPEDIINLRQAKLSSQQRKFICDFSVWIYRAIWVYQKRNEDTEVIHYRGSTKVGKGKSKLSDSFLDVVMELLRFNRENRNYFMFIARNIHSGCNRINWTKTISRTQAVIAEDSAFYPTPVNRKRQVNFEEELLIIFYSILDYIKTNFGFPVESRIDYELIIGPQFERYKNGYGAFRLRQIKYKYFSDKARRLWDLCYAFFDCSKPVPITSDREEYLLANDFHVVFEAIIDELIGDKKEDLPDDLKDQPDGKRVDHLYKDRSLTSADKQDIYYIGDSKYYKINNEITRESVYKQFTYARNVIQWNIDLFNRGSAIDKAAALNDGHHKWLDETTEGYDIIPNFFISASLVLDSKDPQHPCPKKGVKTIKASDKKETKFDSYHFSDRLFDRDTLLITHYDVNFLYIVSLYARENATEKLWWKNYVRDEFRKAIREKLQEVYEFRVLTPLKNVAASPGGVREFLSRDFQLVLGKMFRPYANDQEGHQFYSLALRKDATDKDEIINFVKQGFAVGDIIDDHHMGDAPQTFFVGNVYDDNGKDSALLGLQIVKAGTLHSNDSKNPINKRIRDSGLCPCLVSELKGSSPEQIKTIVYTMSTGANFFKVADRKWYKFRPGQDPVPQDIESNWTANWAGVQFNPGDEFVVWKVKYVDIG